MLKNVFFIFSLIVTISLFACCNKTKPGDKIPMKNISYGNHSQQKIDISLPAGAAKNKKVPIALYIHGGSWMGGDKSDFDWMKENTNNFNCAYVTMNYRLLQDNVTYEEMLDDVHDVITYLKDNSEKYNLKTDKMFVMGNSAGGHLALLYSYSKQSPIEIACVVSQVGPTDFLDPGQIELNGKEKLEMMNMLLGTNVTLQQIDNPDFSFPESWRIASPIYHINNSVPPTVLAYGEKDELVSYTNALRFNDKLEEFGVTHKLIGFPNSGHSLNKDPDKSEEFWQILISYINDYLF